MTPGNFDTNPVSHKSRRKNLRWAAFLAMLVFLQGRFWWEGSMLMETTNKTTKTTAATRTESESEKPLPWLFRPQPPRGMEPRGRIFYCGYKNPLIEYIFPDYEFVGDSEWEEGLEDKTSEQDILVVGLWGPGCNRRKGDERTSFAGKILYVNGESEGDPVSRAWHETHKENVYQIGPYPNSHNTNNNSTNNSTNNNSSFVVFHQSHSLQVYQTAMEFLGNIYLSTHYGVRFDDTADIDPFATSRVEHEWHAPPPTIEQGQRGSHSTASSSSLPVWDPWTQLIQGQDRQDALRRPFEPPRIPAIVYVQKNCVPYRQATAKLLARAFRDLAPSVVPGKDPFEQDPPPTDDPPRRLRQVGTSTGSTASQTGGHPRAAAFEFHAARSQLLELRTDPTHPKSLFDKAHHQGTLPVWDGKPFRTTYNHDGEFDYDNYTTSDNDNDDDHEDDNSSSFLHYGGQCRVKGGIPVPPTVLEGWRNTERSRFRTNYETIYTRYKYCLVMENTKKEGYVTEKLMHALLGGCLPIYYGSKDVYKIFRKDSFVYLDIDNPQPALDEIRRLENHPLEYRRWTNRSLPLLNPSRDPRSGKATTANTVDDYFSLLPDIGTGKLCRQIHEMMGLPLPESLRSKKAIEMEA